MAGGLGKRMKSTLPKVLHDVGGIPMIVRVIRQALPLNPVKILVIVGDYRDIIQETIEKCFSCEVDVVNKIEYVIQPVALGTGHAMQCTIPHLQHALDSHTLILSGDVPLLTTGTLTDFIRFGIDEDRDAVLMTQTIENPAGKGRVFTKNGEFLRIVEEKDCTEEEVMCKVSNCGIYLFKTHLMCKYLPEIQNNNKQNEYYLTDLPAIMKRSVSRSIMVWSLPHDKEHEMLNINNKEELERANQYIIQKQTNSA